MQSARRSGQAYDSRVMPRLPFALPCVLVLTSGCAPATPGDHEDGLFDSGTRGTLADGAPFDASTPEGGSPDSPSTPGEAGRGDAARSDSGTPDSGPFEAGSTDGAIASSCPSASAPVDHLSYVPPAFAPADAARLLILGDSLAFGSGASAERLAFGPLFRTNASDVWPAFDSVALESWYRHPLTYANIAVPGATTDDVVQNQLPILRSGGPYTGHTIIVLAAGANDLDNRVALADPTGPVLDHALANLETIIPALRDSTTFPDGSTVMMMDVYDPTDDTGVAGDCTGPQPIPGLAAAFDVWRTRYTEFAMTHGVAMIDILCRFRGHAWNYNHADNPFYRPSDPTFWFRDCGHPNDRGEHEIRRLLFETIDPSHTVTDTGR